MALLGTVVSYAVPPGRYERRWKPAALLYPAAEVAALLLIAACVIAFGVTVHAAAAAIFCVALVVVTATDLEYRVVPNRIVLPAAVLVLAGMTASDPSPEWALAALGASLFLFLTVLVYPKGMGMGDVKLAFLMGAALGRSVLIALVVALVVSLVPSLVLLARHGSAARKMGFAFAPFLALGSLVALFAGA